MVLSLLFLTACATPSLSKKGKLVKVLSNPIPERCFQLGKIKYDGSPFTDQADLTVVMKNLAADLGGNGVRMDVFVPGVKQLNDAKGRGTVFKCKPGARDSSEARLDSSVAPTLVK